MDAVHAGGLGGTYGGNPVACAAALAAIETMRELDLRRARPARSSGDAAAAAGAGQERHPVIGDVRGRGAMLAVELVRPGHASPTPSPTGRIARACHAPGVVVLTCGTLRQRAPLPAAAGHRRPPAGGGDRRHRGRVRRGRARALSPAAGDRYRAPDGNGTARTREAVMTERTPALSRPAPGVVAAGHHLRAGRGGCLPGRRLGVPVAEPLPGPAFPRLAFAISIEPVVHRLERRGMRRGLATGLVMFGFVALVALFIGVFGALLVDQSGQLIRSTPEVVRSVVSWVNDTFGTNFLSGDIVDALRLTPERIQELAENFSPDLVGFVTTTSGSLPGVHPAAVRVLHLGRGAEAARRRLHGGSPPGSSGSSPRCGPSRSRRPAGTSSPGSCWRRCPPWSPPSSC